MRDIQKAEGNQFGGASGERGFVLSTRFFNENTLPKRMFLEYNKLSYLFKNERHTKSESIYPLYANRAEKNECSVFSVCNPFRD